MRTGDTPRGGALGLGRPAYGAAGRGTCRGRATPPGGHFASVCFAVASIAASDFLTWLRSVVYQKSGSEAFR